MYLYEVNAQIENLYLIAQTGIVGEGYEHLANEDGSVNQEALNAEIEALFTCKDDIIEDTARLVQNLEAEAQMLKTEEERLRDRRKKAEERVAFLEDRLTDVLGASKWASQKSSLRITFRPSESLIVDDESKIDQKFIKTEIVTKVDKVGAKKALKSGANLEGCHIEQRQNINIK